MIQLPYNQWHNDKNKRLYIQLDPAEAVLLHAYVCMPDLY